MEKILRPNPERHFLVSVMRANGVQNHEPRQQNPGSVGKLQSSIGQPEPAGKNHQQNIFQDPRLPIQWPNRRYDPDRGANRDQCNDDFVRLVQLMRDVAIMRVGCAAFQAISR
jgi:hypothetical protein